jgi:putative transposase
MYGSLWRCHQTTEPLPKILSPLPIHGLPNWTSRVHEPLSEKELNAIRTCLNRGRPFSDEQWTEKVAEKHGIWYTMRPVGRPRMGRMQPK